MVEATFTAATARGGDGGGDGGGGDGGGGDGDGVEALLRPLVEERQKALHGVGSVYPSGAFSGP